MSLLLALLAAGIGLGPRSLPPAVRDFKVDSTTATTVTLRWTAPDAWDDSTDAKVSATEYILHYWDQDPATYDGDWFTDAPAAGPLPAPQEAGKPETFTVESLDPGVKYYFRILAMYGRTPGTLSDYASGTTVLDTIPPQAVTTLQVTATDETSVTLAWTAPGDFEQPSQTIPSAVAHYELKYSTEGPIGAAAYATATSFAPSLLWIPRLPGELESNRVVSGLEPDRTYWFALKSFDQVAAPSLVSNSPSAMLSAMAPSLGGQGHRSMCPFSATGSISTALLGLALLGVSIRRK